MVINHLRFMEWYLKKELSMFETPYGKDTGRNHVEPVQKTIHTIDFSHLC